MSHEEDLDGTLEMVSPLSMSEEKEPKHPLARLTRIPSRGDPKDSNERPEICLFREDHVSLERGVHFGRSDRAHESCRYGDARISGVHCVVFIEEKTDSLNEYELLIQDRSSNGTFVNRRRIPKGENVSLQHGDIFSLCSANPREEIDGENLPAFMVSISNSSLYSPYASMSMEREIHPVSQRSISFEDDSIAPCESSSSSPPRKRTKTQPKVSESSLLSDPELSITTESSSHPLSSSVIPDMDTSSSSKALSIPGDSHRPEKNSSSFSDRFSEEMQCSICRNFFYRCVTALPCLHSYCSSCLSEWIKRSTSCPSCRKQIHVIQRNHTVNNLVEAFLEQHPEHRPSPEDIEQMEKMNTITEDSLVILNRKHFVDFGDDDVDYDTDEYDSDEWNDSSGSNMQGSSLATCRECYAAGPDGFTCNSDSPSHCMCRFCLQRMPVRDDSCQRKQKCDLCSSVMCDQYFSHSGGCQNPGGRLKRLDSWTFPSLPRGCFGGNNVERGILETYLSQHGLSANECFIECLQKLSSNDFSTDNVPARILVRIDHDCCEMCALSVFSELVVQYREHIPNSDLPDWVTRRPDCWYGKNCRTQRHRLTHAQNYNHACPQIRF